MLKVLLIKMQLNLQVYAPNTVVNVISTIAFCTEFSSEVGCLIMSEKAYTVIKYILPFSWNIPSCYDNHQFLI